MGDEARVNEESSVILSRVQELQYLNMGKTGWTDTNEDHWLLLEGVKGITRSGGFFSVGEFQNLDIALELGATAIVLGDLDQQAVKTNAAILRIVETASDVSEVMPRIVDFLEKLRGSEAFKEKLTEKGTNTGARIRLRWAQGPMEFARLKELIAQGRVAVAQVDITKPETMDVVGKFFSSHGTRLESAYLSNIISWRLDNDQDARQEHIGSVEALKHAGASEGTLLIRSGSTTSLAVVRKMGAFLPKGYSYSDEDYRKMVGKDLASRDAHYGPKVTLLPERIERTYTGSFWQQGFEFFTQEFKDYEDHVETF